jgi:hypothetical protein
LKLSGYNKTRHDAIMSVPVAPSVGGTLSPNIAINVGTIRNTGVEADWAARLVDQSAVAWSVNGNLSANRNRVVNLNPGAQALLNSSSANGVATVIRPGFPLNGFWGKPITSYADENHDGFIEAQEIRISDSAAYLGSDLPKYELNAATRVSLFHGRVVMNTAIAYDNGLTQLNQSANLLTQIYNNPQSTFSQQAAVAAGNIGCGGCATNSDIGRVQTVSTLRWSSLSISWITPPVVARWLRSSQVGLTLQGSNLGLHSNYSGKDPDVNAFSSGNLSQDSGQLPQPRTWSVRLDLR